MFRLKSSHALITFLGGSSAHRLARYVVQKMAAWNGGWYNEDWQGDDDTSTVEPEDIRKKMTYLTNLLVVLQEECRANRKQLNALVDEKKSLAARVYELEQGKRAEQQQLSVGSIRGSGCRRDRPRSGSLPPTTTCFFHEAGNFRKAGPLPDYGLTSLTSATDAYEWWSHIYSVMFSTRAPLGDELWKWLEYQFARNRVTVQHYYTKKVRHFYIECNQCEEKFIMCYDKNKTLEEREQLINDLAVFTQCTRYIVSVGYCPRKRNDALLALTHQ